LPLAAIALIGFVGSSAVFAQAQPPAKPGGPVATNGPQPFKCDPTDKMFQVQNGTNDNFVGTGTADPKPHPVGIPGLNTSNIYDQTASNYHFGDSFTLPAGQITRIRLTTRLKANSGDANNDGISFSASPTFTPGHFGFALNTLVPGWGTSAPAKLFVFDFDASGAQVHVNVPGSPFSAGPPYSGAAFYADLTLNHVLHMYVQDDTSVDFIQIEGCAKPLPPKYDLVASKKHDGNVYVLNVHNAGSQIMPTGKVDVTEIVPAGLIIDSASGAPWQCPGVIFPVIGPDAFTCSYQIPPGGIAANSPLPAIILKTEGKSECPNCMRVKLFLKSMSDGVKPVEEGDMKNNASCTM
jgi:hypothetical protein